MSRAVYSITLLSSLHNNTLATAAFLVLVAGEVVGSLKYCCQRGTTLLISFVHPFPVMIPDNHNNVQVFLKMPLTSE